MKNLFDFIPKKLFYWLFLASVGVFLSVIASVLKIIFDGEDITSYDLNSGVMMFLVSGLIIYIYKQKNKKE